MQVDTKIIITNVECCEIKEQRMEENNWQNLQGWPLEEITFNEEESAR